MDTRLVAGLDFADALGRRTLHDSTLARGPGPRVGRLRSHTLLDHRVPGAACRTATHPFGRVGATLIAEPYCFFFLFCHRRERV